MHQRIVRRRRRRREGMTLVEIMIVVIIMALIATAVGYAVIPMLTDGQEHMAETNAAAIRSGVFAYFVGGGEDCPSFDDLVEADVLDGQAEPQDPWGTDYAIECEGADVFVTSAGPDRELGTEDGVPDRRG